LEHFIKTVEDRISSPLEHLIGIAEDGISDTLGTLPGHWRTGFLAL
jgi:hypothetical protein